ncbi:hypothetical protein CLOM_g19133 [Closterium sp. NIES-68]|nr:hypothetical protein CLOM_g19133 [Closterium sp. NIES-68]
MLSELAFAYDCLPAGLPIAAVTGTNGKSTVATFAGQILESIGIHTFVGGNLGTPLSLAALDFVTSQHGRAGSSKPIQAAVVEVSSYQMELPGRFRPKAAVILNLTPDHLERHGSMASYGAAKCRLFARMEEPDIAVIPSDDPLLERLAGEAGGHPSMAWLGRLPGCCVDHAERSALLQLPCSRSDASSGDAGGCAFPAPLTLDLSPLGAVGRHNAENAAVAALLCLALGLEGSGVSLEGVQSAVKVLRPPPHRMELVVVDDQDRSWINDSKATNVEASTAGIQGLGEESMAVILLGGIAKVLKSLDAGDGGSASPLGFSKLVSVLNRHRAVITFGQSGPAIASELTASGLSAPLIQCETMEQAMHAASDTALPDDTILLSPACASFDEFDNFEHRGHVFADIAQKLSQV